MQGHHLALESTKTWIVLEVFLSYDHHIIMKPTGRLHWLATRTIDGPILYLVVK